jgi:hypothetical protein
LDTFRFVIPPVRFLAIDKLDLCRRKIKFGEIYFRNRFSEIFADTELKADLEGTLHCEDDTDHQEGSEDHPKEQLAWKAVIRKRGGEGEGGGG